MGKVDKGFEFFYFNLSYRRKFIRTLWLSPLAIFSVYYVYVKMQSFKIAAVVGLVLIIIDAVQLWYNYHKWKNEEKQKTHVS